MDDRPSTTFKRLRLHVGLTQEALAERSGVSVRTIRGLETGTRRNPQRSSLRQLADAMELSAGDRAELMAAVVGGAAAARPVPRQLPPPPHRFTGRDSELAELTRAATAAGRGAVAVSAVGGAGGIGKTWLVLHWAHRHADDFPDGQLYANLRGFDASGTPARPEAVVRGFLEALGVPSASLPLEAEAQYGLFRSLTEGRRLLIVLDNARDTGQLAPLLPGRSACVVLVTSRHRLAGLVATHGATTVELDVLAPAEARRLLTRHVGRARTDREADAVDELLAHCSGLPLALGIVAARATGNPAFPLRALADELRTARLDGFDAGELNADLRAVFSASYGVLDPEAGRLFGLLGLAPVTESGVPAAASLAGWPATKAGQVLRVLENAHLVGQPRPGRYRMHDLIGRYATERARADLPPRDRAPALDRLVDHYVHTAVAADRVLRERSEAAGLGEPAEGCVPEAPADIGTAMAWLATEHGTLLAIQAAAAARGRHEAVWRLGQALAIFHWRRALFAEDVVSSRRALAAAEALGDPAATAIVARNLGYDLLRLGERAQAAACLERARRINEEHGFTEALAHTFGVLTHLADLGGDHRTAIGYAIRSARLFRSIGKPVDEANALNAMGWHHAMLGEFESAREYCATALDMLVRSGGRRYEVCALHSLGYIAKRTGRYAEALRYFRRSIPVYHDIGDKFAEANAHVDLAEVHAAMADPAAAETAWRTALAMFETQNRTADARRVRQRLTGLERRPALRRGAAPDATLHSGRTAPDFRNPADLGTEANTGSPIITR
ncbi:tetratricopeptide repeat protein [Amycolatopsis sp. CA-128772]|uniref:ATP-binding protein n=1 Tax=Amycolatopsis sp. CA-128772 TaxID=2073159 RepID=UPI001304FBFC|nr:helix-turn-helix domain-containing protein [Amycolatopsis sp. CA-128772]